MSYLDEFGDPSEDQINDWNIHNDHQDDNDNAFDLVVVCDWCDAKITDTSNSDGLCKNCQNEYDQANPHPLDIAEQEEREAEFFGLDDERDMGY